MNWGPPTTATIERSGGAVAQGGTSAYQTHLTLTVRAFMGILLHPKSAEYALNTFNVEVVAPAMIFADWPTTTETLPVRPKDRLVVNGATYVVHGAKHYAGDHIEILVSVPLS